MPLSLHESRRRSRRQSRSRVVAGFTIFVAISALVFASYMAGGRLARQELGHLQQRIDQQTTQIAALDEQNVKSQGEAREAAVQEQRWKQLYEREVPTGPTKDLQVLLQKRIAEGIQPSRLQLVISGVVNDPGCDEKPVTKRFIVRTPLQPSGNDSVGFADNTVTITAEGKPSSDNAGNKSGSFDPTQPVHVSFLLLGGRKFDTTGVLPIRYSVITQTAEYRFNLVASDNKGFMNVTGDRCRAPS